MNIIDRYLLRQFLQAFAICFLSLTGLYIVFDTFTNLEEFLRCGEKTGGVIPLIASFYSYQSLVFFDRTSGLLSLVSAMFTVAWIQRHNEMTALLAAGISRVRVLKPVIIAVLSVSAVAIVNREVIIPHFRDEVNRRPQDLLGDIGQEMQPRYDNQTDLVIRGRHTFADQRRIQEPCFVLPRNLDHYAKQISAATADFRPADENHPQGYLLDEVTEPKDLAKRSSLLLDEKPLVITPQDAAWLKPNQCFIASNLDFDQLCGGRAFRQFASTPQLIFALRNPSMDFGADVKVAIHARIVQPFLDVTLLFLGLPMIATRGTRNVFIAIGLCLGIVTAFLMVVIGSQSLGTICMISPALAAWLPLMLCAPAAVAVAEGMWK